MAATINIFDTSFPALGAPDAFGVCWYYALDGWDGPDVRSEYIRQPNVHGARAGEWAYEPRALVFRGIAWCPDEATMWNAMDRLALVTDATDGVVELRVATPVRTLNCLVRRNGALKMNPRTDRVIEFSAPLVADDPRKYSLATTTWTGSSAPTMLGTAYRTPLITVEATGGSGGAINFRFTNATDTPLALAYDHSIANGEKVTFTFATQTASSTTRGDVTGDISLVSIWPNILRGVNDFDAWTDSGNVSGKATWKDAWI